MKRSVDDARRHGVESNVLFRILGSEASQQRVQPTLGDHGNGRRQARNRIVGQRRGDADDAAARFLQVHLLHGELRDVDESRDVGGHEIAKILRRVGGEGLHREDAGIGDHRVDGAEVLYRRLGQVVRGFELAYVAIDQGELRRGRELLRFRHGPCVAYHVVATRQECADEPRAYAL